MPPNLTITLTAATLHARLATVGRENESLDYDRQLPDNATACLRSVTFWRNHKAHSFKINQGVLLDDLTPALLVAVFQLPDPDLIWAVVQKFERSAVRHPVTTYIELQQTQLALVSPKSLHRQRIMTIHGNPITYWESPFIPSAERKKLGSFDNSQ